MAAYCWHSSVSLPTARLSTFAADKNALLSAVYFWIIVQWAWELQEEELRRELAAAHEAAGAARRDADAEKERFKRVIQELKKKLDRCQRYFCSCYRVPGHAAPMHAAQTQLCLFSPYV